MKNDYAAAYKATANGKSDLLASVGIRHKF